VQSDLSDKEKRQLRRDRHEKLLSLLDRAEDVRHEVASARPQHSSSDRRIDVTPLQPGQKRRERAVDPNWAYRPSGTKERDGR
jgi:hypothetical protein